MSEKTVLGCSAGTLVLCVFPWWSMENPFADFSVNAFESTWGVLTFLCALATVGSIVGVKKGVLKVTPELALRLPLFAAAAATVFALIFVVSGPGGDLGRAAAFTSEGGKTIWPWISLILMGTATYVAFQRVTAANRRATE